jgi:coenzyme PQQ precursor peptide PqqA
MMRYAPQTVGVLLTVLVGLDPDMPVEIEPGIFGRKKRGGPSRTHRMASRLAFDTPRRSPASRECGDGRASLTTPRRFLPPWTIEKAKIAMPDRIYCSVWFRATSLDPARNVPTLVAITNCTCLVIRRQPPIPRSRRTAHSFRRAARHLFALATKLACSLRGVAVLSDIYAVCQPRRKMTMKWETPTLVEICIGLEINGYLPAEL